MRRRMGAELVEQWLLDMNDEPAVIIIDFILITPLLSSQVTTFQPAIKSLVSHKPAAMRCNLNVLFLASVAIFATVISGAPETELTARDMSNLRK